MENVLDPNFSYSPDMLFNSYYDSSYSGLDLLNSYQYESPDLPIFEFYGNVRRMDVSENEDINRYDFPEDERINGRYDISDDEDRNLNHQEREYDNSEYEEEENKLELNQGMEFETWELAESYLNEYAKQQGFSFRKKRRILDPTDSTITRRRTYKCSHARTHEIQKVILEENRRDRDSEMIGCLWHINLSFPKSGNGSSWACYAINQNFTAGIQSTQRVESTNKIIKDRLNRSSCLTDVIKKIQKIFNQQSKKAILNEYKNEIPTRGIPSIMDEYFPELDKILREYLTPQILQKQRDQMAQSLCYDVKLIEDWLPLLEMVDDSYQQEMARKDDYDQPQSLFSSLIKNIPHNSIRQDNNIKQQHKELVYQIEENELEKGPRLSFQHLANFRQTPNIVQPRGPKQKYGFGMGYAKKALDLAIWADKVDEFVNQIEYFIESVKYKSCGEPQKKKVRRIQDITNTTTNKNHKEDVVASQEGKKKERRCKNCNQVGHYAPRYFVKLEESHSEKNIKEFFLKSFKDFEIITKIFDITTDNASNNNTFFEEVSNEFAEKNIEFDNVNQHVYYLTYIINLTTQKAFKLLKAIVNINENEFLNQYENIQNNNNQVGVVGSILYKVNNFYLIHW
ncbi:uncharacterized protein OCT59_015135 [Rhizophagus irregularis]|uniref:uncharacterized protein n=1 Tax=Rhizophagus irregularis TaxID=588596 RepID=UPI0033345B6E|nr:hypothetical protein OCT59_015135 [Rhizophagus irregularis]